MGPVTQALLSAGTAFLVVVGLTPVVRALARRVGQVAQPRKDRYHRKPTALMGGMAIFGGFAVAFGVGWILRGDLTLGAGIVSAGSVAWLQDVPKLLLAVGCATAMFGLGLLDDFFNFRPAIKLAGQVVIAAVFVAGGVGLTYTFIPTIDAVITIVWLVGITNAVNLLDNLDGLAAGVTAIAAGFLTFFFLSGGLYVEAGIAAALVGASLGFLLYNWSPATIFMGDSGSLFLGFLLASVTLFSQSHRTRNLLATLGVPLLVLLVPILDTALVTLARRAHGRAVSQGGTDHISHRLVALGLSDRSTVLVIYLVALVSGVVAVLVRDLAAPLAIALVVLFVAALVAALAVIVRVRVYGSGAAHAQEAGGAQTQDHKSAPFSTSTQPVGWLGRLVARPTLLLVGYDLMAVVFCYYVAFLLRFGNNPLPFMEAFVTSLPLVVGTQLALLWTTGLYRTLWSRGSALDVLRLGLSVLVAGAGAVAVTTLFFRFEGLSRAVFAIDAVLLFLALATGRMAGRATRLLSQEQDRRHHARTLVVGAGAAGDAAVRELGESLRWGMRPVGFLDDDRSKLGLRVRGLRVLGTLENLEAVAQAHHVTVVLIAISTPPAGLCEALGRRCDRAGFRLHRFRLEMEPISQGGHLDHTAPR